MHHDKRILDTLASRLRIHAGAVTSGMLQSSKNLVIKRQLKKFGQCLREYCRLIETAVFFSLRMERDGHDARGPVERRGAADLRHLQNQGPGKMRGDRERVV